jgi:hypothetical protein
VADLAQDHVGADGRRHAPDPDDDILVQPTPASPPLDPDDPISCEWRATSGRPRSRTAGRSLPRGGTWPAFLTAREWRTLHTVTQSGGSSPDWSRSIRHV